MKQWLYSTILSFLFCGPAAFAGNNKISADTTKPVYSILNNSKSGSLDSNILIVVNGTVAGTIRELKTDLATAFHPETIESINVLKDSAAINKYGERGRPGVLEFMLKKVTMEEVALTDTPKTDGNPGDENKVFDRVEVEASFPGGGENWRKYLEKNLNANIPMENNAPMGYFKVIVQFVVDRQGNVSDIKSLTSHGYGMEAEVIRVILKQPKWLPAMQNGRAVNAYRKQPVTFVLEGEVDIQTKESYILYAGINNPMKINAGKIKDEDLEFSLSHGTITRVSEGNYLVRTDKQGTVILTLKDKKKNKEIERIAFTVK